MKFKVKHEKNNLVFMSSVIILCFITCIFWLMLREYIYFCVYFIISLIITHLYYVTSYIIENDSLVIKLGFIKVKFKYEKLLRVNILDKSINLVFKNFKMNIYPSNKEIFYAELVSKMKGSK